LCGHVVEHDMTASRTSTHMAFSEIALEAQMNQSQPNIPTVWMVRRH